MSLLLAAALSGAGVSDSADICRVDRWRPQPFPTDIDYRPDFRLSGARYIPPFADTPEAHEQTRRAAGIVTVASREIFVPETPEERVAMIEVLLVRAQLCGRGTRSVQPMARRDLGSPAT
jgi:hypothetical protein